MVFIRRHTMERYLPRINELARLAKERELNEEETRERARLRAAYLKAFRESFRAQLDNTLVEYPDGSRKPLKDAGKHGINCTG
jgi:uncharacterized protein YnzC (UPF0291/DUF896 family)